MDEERVSGDGEERPDQGAIGFNWVPNCKILQALINLGLDKNTATKALYYTDNDSVEKAMDYIFQNPNPSDLGKTTLEEDLGIEFNLTQKFDLMGLPYDDDDGVCKMVFILNTSLNMSLGKCCSQVSHATIGILKEMFLDDKEYDKYKKWVTQGQKKIVLSAKSEQELESLKTKASSLNLKNQIIQDAGITEVKPGSKTVLVIFGECNQVDKVTGHLKLLK